MAKILCSWNNVIIYEFPLTWATSITDFSIKVTTNVCDLRRHARIYLLLPIQGHGSSCEGEHHGGHTWRCTTASHLLLNLKPGIREQPQTSSVHGFTLGTSRVANQEHWLRSPASHRGSPGQSMWDLWWTKWHWDRFFSEFFGFPVTVDLQTHIIWGMRNMLTYVSIHAWAWPTAPSGKKTGTWPEISVQTRTCK
jgi:hypothetical protein